MGALLLFCLKNPAQVISFLTMVKNLVEKGVDWVDLQKALSDFDQAAKKAQDTKDTSGLENLFDPKSNS